MGRAAAVVRRPLIRMTILLFGVLGAVIGASVLVAVVFGTSGAAARAATTLTAVVVAAAAYSGLVRLIERRAVTELAWSGALPEFGRGLLLGALLMAASVGVLWLLGAYHVTGIGSIWATGSILAASVTAGVIEELVFRGIVFRSLEDVFGTWAALAVSAVLFGVIHITNPNASWWAAIAIAIEAGILLGAAFVLTRRLWMVIGLHMAWNYVQGGVFGVTVSGIAVSGLLQSTLSGPDLVSGGSFGLEASVCTVAITLSAGLVFTVRAHRMGHFARPRWRRPRPLETAAGDATAAAVSTTAPPAPAAPEPLVAPAATHHVPPPDPLP